MSNQIWEGKTELGVMYFRSGDWDWSKCDDVYYDDLFLLRTLGVITEFAQWIGDPGGNPHHWHTMAHVTTGLGGPGLWVCECGFQCSAPQPMDLPVTTTVPDKPDVQAREVRAPKSVITCAVQAVDCTVTLFKDGVEKLRDELAVRDGFPFIEVAKALAERKAPFSELVIGLVRKNDAQAAELMTQSNAAFQSVKDHFRTRLDLALK